MNIYLNGEKKEVEALLLKDLITDPKGVAVAVNEKLIPRANWSMRLNENDRVEVIHAVFGG